MDHGFAEVRSGANSGAVVKGERSHASCLPSREKAGAESLPVEAAGKVSTCVRRSKSARKLCSRWPVPRVLMKARRLPSGESVSEEARPRSTTKLCRLRGLGSERKRPDGMIADEEQCVAVPRKERSTALHERARWERGRRRERARSRLQALRCRCAGFAGLSSGPSSVVRVKAMLLASGDHARL